MSFFAFVLRSKLTQEIWLSQKHYLDWNRNKTIDLMASLKSVVLEKGLAMKNIGGTFQS